MQYYINDATIALKFFNQNNLRLEIELDPAEGNRLFISVLNVLVLTLIPFYFERFIERIKIFWTDSIFFNQGRIKRSKHFFLNKSKLVLRKRKKIKILNTSNNSFQIRKYVFGVEFFLGSYLLTKISFVKVSFYN